LAVLADYAQGQKAKVDWLRKSKLPLTGTCSRPLTSAPKKADIEDFFGPDLYVELVNEAYGLKAPAPSRLRMSTLPRNHPAESLKRSKPFGGFAPAYRSSTTTFRPCGWFKTLSGSGKAIPIVPRAWTGLKSFLRS
jgi:hypothetical protein